MSVLSPSREALAGLVTLPDVKRPDQRFDPTGDKYLIDGKPLFLRNTVALLGVSVEGNQTVAVYGEDESLAAKSRETSEDIIHTCEQAVLKRFASAEEIASAYNANVLNTYNPRYLRVLEWLQTSYVPDVFQRSGITSNPYVELPRRQAQLV